jgi:MoaA/NifB/PqqE/SkfB family radical SAM enzyme
MNAPQAVWADSAGRIWDHPRLQMAVWDGARIRPPRPEELVPLPPGSDFLVLPGRRPLGWDPAGGEAVDVEAAGGGAPTAVSTFLAPAWLRLCHPAWRTEPGAVELPLFAYAPLGWRQGRLWTTALRVDADPRQDPWRFDLRSVRAGIRWMRRRHPGNRLVTHLEHCALVYQCRAAQNYFLRRWEAPLPVARSCNARCLGCISLQPAGGVQASHERIRVRLEPEEVAEVAVGHLERVPDAVVSFGQGCEGEPLLEGRLLVEAVRLVRARTRLGVVNLNTNASRPDLVAELAESGLDSIRISLNSARPRLYEAFYRPEGYGLAEVLASAQAMSRRGRYVALNLLVLPGINDCQEDLGAIVSFIAEGGVRMVQLRNLNLDPERYLREIGPGAVGEPFGFLALVRRLRQRFPHLRFGYFNPPRSRFGWPGPLPGARRQGASPVAWS